MPFEPSFRAFFLRRLAVIAAACWLSLVALRATASADQSAAPSASALPADEKEEKAAPDSPRAAMSEFAQLTRSGDYQRAARYLDLSAVEAGDGPLLAKRLRDVLDRHLFVDLEKLSPNPHGNTDDGSTPDRDDLGSVPGAAGKPEPVTIVRRVDRNGARWVFSASTVAHIDAWYDHLENRWLLDHLPKWALRFGPRELRWWQWLALAPLVLIGLLVAFTVTRLSRLALKHWLPKYSTDVVRKLRGPATLAWTVITSYALLPWLGLYEPAEAFVRRGLSAGFLAAFFWALWQGVELSLHTMTSAHWAKASHTAASLMLLGAKLGKFVVAAFALVAVLAELGYPVTSLITGLGIGGVALALAAQKTVENLFGAFSLAIDQPFREGDTIQVDTITGTVETIGLRSTRLRTADRTLITIPNGKLAEMRVETITARDRMRFYCVLGVTHSPAKQITRILNGIERVLRDSSLVAEDSISVRLISLTDSAMNLEIIAMLETSDNAKFLEARQGLLLGIIEVVDDAGSSLAHPVSSIRLSDANQAQLLEPAPAATPDAS
ncbi:MAG TPA: mechanosensitive ion channel family protein [Polyangiaceae bacterium]|jgi:MscS family membrane protein|nr:mechanosensitive ion channel family protein [Polyangiaceae bacterium]